MAKVFTRVSTYLFTREGSCEQRLNAGARAGGLARFGRGQVSSSYPMKLHPFEVLRASVDESSISSARRALSERDWNPGDACFVATLEALRDDLTGDAPVVLIANEALDFGDGLLSLQMTAGDPAARAAALAWGLADVLPSISDSHWLESALTLMERYGLGEGEPSHAEMFRAVASTLRAHPETRGAVWKWFAAEVPVHVEAGVVTIAEAREILDLGHRGATKRLVSDALGALGGAQESAAQTATTRVAASTSSSSTLDTLAAQLGTEVPSRGEVAVGAGSCDVLGPSRLASLEDKEASRLLSARRKLGKCVEPALSLLGVSRADWVARASVSRRRGRWLLVRLDRIQTPHDPARQEPSFEPSMLLDDACAALFRTHPPVSVAILAVTDGYAGLLWSGEETYGEIAEAEERATVLWP